MDLWTDLKTYSVNHATYVVLLFAWFYYVQQINTYITGIKREIIDELKYLRSGIEEVTKEIKQMNETLKDNNFEIINTNDNISDLKNTLEHTSGVGNLLPKNDPRFDPL